MCDIPPHVSRCLKSPYLITSLSAAVCLATLHSLLDASRGDKTGYDPSLSFTENGFSFNAVFICLCEIAFYTSH